MLAFRESSKIRLTALLTAEQRTRMTELLGAPFRFEIPAPRALDRPANVPNLPAPRPVVGTFQFDLSKLALARLAEPSVQEELQLSEEQIREIRKVGVSRAVESHPLLELQQRRLRQIDLRIRQRESGPRGILYYSEVVDELKLSEGQREQIETILRNGVIAALRQDPHQASQQLEQQILQQVFTAEQQETWRRLLGTPFDGELTDRFALPLDAVIAASLKISSVAKELILTDEQVEQANQPATERKPLSELLTKEQLTRLREIHLQIDQRRLGPATILRYGEVADALKLSNEQRAKIRAIRRPGSFSERLSLEDQATAARLADEQFLEVLSPDQQATWKDLLGEPFQGEVPPLGLFRAAPPAPPKP
jgi:hypothetical protein